MKPATNAPAGAADEPRRRVDLEDAAVDDHTDPVGERGSVLEVVGHEHGREDKACKDLAQL